MPPTRPAFALLAAALLLTSCTGSDGGEKSGSKSPAQGSSTGRAASSAASSATPTATASGTRTAGSSSASVAPKPLSTMIRQGAHATYTVRVWAQESVTTCVPYARGTKILAYLRAHRCSRLVRYLATTTADGKAVGVSGSMITFAGGVGTGGQAAAGFTALAVDAGNGPIDDLFGDGRRLPGGPSALPSVHAANARNDGATVAVVDAWYLKGSTRSDDPALSELLEAIT